jgi:biopolymer transport protein ExbB/TolQ
MIYNSQVVFEIVIAIAVVIIQLIFFFSSYGKIRLLSALLPQKKLDESFLQTSETPNGSIQLIKTDTNTFSEHFIEIIGSINKYLSKNQGATDFSIIKSIVERSIESKENSVASNVSLPLYVGLMGTFTGIIVGLLKIAFFGGVTDENINSFIGGVVIAMVASFFGLLLTVLNNSKNFRKAKATCDERKNAFYDFLQVVLLPHLGNSLFDALDRLKYNINDFNKKFETNIQLFDSKFSVNITTLRDSVESISGSIGTIVENTKSQKEFLTRLDQIGYEKMANANARVFKLIDKVSPTMLQFVEKQSELTASVEHAAQFIGTIENILNRIKIFEESINRLGENINSKQYLSGQIIERVDKNLNQLDKQFELLQRHEVQASETIEEFFKKQYKKIEELTDNIRHEVERALLGGIYENPLQKLVLLEKVEKNIEEINIKMNFNNEFKKISGDLSATKSELSDIKQKLIKAIEEGRKRSNRVESREEQKKEKQDEKQEEKPTQESKKRKSILKRFTNLFNWKRGRKA